jgi:hypothetical protein
MDNRNYDTNFRRQVFQNNFPNSGRTVVPKHVPVVPTIHHEDLQPDDDGFIGNNQVVDDEGEISADEGDVSVVAEDDEEVPAAVVHNNNDDEIDDDNVEEGLKGLEEEFDDFNMQEILGLTEAEGAKLFGSRSSIEQRVRDIIFPRVEIMV